MPNNFKLVKRVNCVYIGTSMIERENINILLEHARAKTNPVVVGYIDSSGEIPVFKGTRIDRQENGKLQGYIMPFYEQRGGQMSSITNEWLRQQNGKYVCAIYFSADSRVVNNGKPLIGYVNFIGNKERMCFSMTYESPF